MSKAFSDISKYRIRKITTTGEESSLAVKDKIAAKRAKIRSVFFVFLTLFNLQTHFDAMSSASYLLYVAKV